MSMPMTSATSGSSTRRWTTRAPHQRATPVTRMRCFLAIVLQSMAGSSPGRSPHPAPKAPTSSWDGEVTNSLVGPLDHVAFHQRDRAPYRLLDRRAGLPGCELELAEQRIERLHRLDRVA